jgi:2-dehydro-3-deoxyphosphogluconate aldolase/(4S)-4-hydroxy-2-oxoglutarate aldolase
MNKAEVRAVIDKVGIIPAIRLSSQEDALFAAKSIASGGVPIIEITMTVPGALDVIQHVIRDSPPGTVVGAGTVLDLETARKCLDVGAHFLTSTGLDLEIVDLALRKDVLVLAGALTPSEVMTAWKAGSDMVKIFPCSQLGGPAYIKVLKAPFPNIPLVAAGGVTQMNATDFMRAGAAAVGIGRDLIPTDAIRTRESTRIRELAHRFVAMVAQARAEKLMN